MTVFMSNYSWPTQSGIDVEGCMKVNEYGVGWKKAWERNEYSQNE